MICNSLSLLVLVTGAIAFSASDKSDVAFFVVLPGSVLMVIILLCAYIGAKQRKKKLVGCFAGSSLFMFVLSAAAAFFYTRSLVHNTWLDRGYGDNKGEVILGKQ
jgi:RsiW-degrading membrane proteinase PrsW (M82 family)